MKKFWEIKNISENKLGELILFGEISDEDWDDNITPKQILDDIKNLGNIDTLNVKVNSAGGSVFAAVAIGNLIREYGKTNNISTIGWNMGLAASAATLILSLCNKVISFSNALYMIHNPFTFAAGNSNDLRKTAQMLDDVREQMISIYEEKTGLSQDKIIELLDNETWMSSEEALEYSFIDEIESFAVAASIENNKLIMNDVSFSLEKIKNIPKEILDSIPKKEKKIKKIIINKGSEEMDINKLKTEYPDIVEEIKNSYVEELKNDENFIDEIRKGYMEVNNVLEMFELPETSSPEDIKSKFDNIKGELEKVQEEFSVYKEEVLNDKKFEERKHKLEEVGIEVKNEQKDEILNMNDFAFKMVLDTASQKNDQFNPHLNFKNDNKKDESTVKLFV